MPSWTPEGSVQPYVHPSLRRPQIFGARPYLRENAAAAAALPIKGTWRKGRTGNKISPFSSPPLPNQGRRKQKKGGKSEGGRNGIGKRSFSLLPATNVALLRPKGKKKLSYTTPPPLFPDAILNGAIRAFCCSLLFSGNGPSKISLGPFQRVRPPRCRYDRCWRAILNAASDGPQFPTPFLRAPPNSAGERRKIGSEVCECDVFKSFFSS